MRPSCACHGLPMWRNGNDGRHRCAVQERERNARRVRAGAGGLNFFIGRAPTPQQAQQLRTRIREEAPHGAVRNP